VALNNTTGNDAGLTGWFDFNRNAVFDNGESVTVTVPNNATSATLTWTGLPTWLPQGPAAGYGFRFRLTTDQLTTPSSTGFANDGEVEDYFILSEILCSIQVKTIDDTTVCGVRPVPLTTTSTNTTTYNWDNFLYLTDVAIASPVATPLVTSRYIITGSNPQGCYAKDTVVITAMQAPVITMSNDATICKGDAAQLSAGVPGSVSYTWSPQTALDDATIPAPVASPNATTTYVVTATGSNGCISEDSVKVIVHGAPIFMVHPLKGTICEKDSMQLTASGGDEFTWLAPDNTTLGISSSIMVQPAASQTYRVLIKENVCNITDTRSIPVVVNENPTLVISRSNDVDCSNGQATLHVSGGNSYVWDVKPGIDNITSANPVVTPPQTTTYSVTVTNSKGCSARDSITVIADLAKGMSSYPVPSAFTPDNDGKNDCFGLKYWGQVTELQFQVFNRWGERVFSTTDPTQCWDGKYKGVLQPAGGFAYLIKAMTRCGAVNRSGIVLLIK
ncbi:MAG TPA: gliding motility-associated C-terminal domain-containing protein, partial [Niastella sp.]